MLVPGFLGYWLDGRLGSGPVLLLLGFAFGFTYGLWQLINLAKQREPSQPNNEQDAE
ncbi:hypothetical protein Pla111_06250 [Botrimarina hoheduenensis]|uniref:F0F1-ATPase subunit n=2 Tax=Botrimarina hoheduenensis TaxID=2528000 RepID=A0A5C5WFI7_9BACT|nr:hypothetical protein Pla111_06250 [Botrimarina hoheduenensis]